MSNYKLPTVAFILIASILAAALSACGSGSPGGATNTTTLPTTTANIVSVAVTPTTTTIMQNGKTQQQFTATGTFPNATTQDVTTLATWASSNPAVATINAAGGMSTAKLAGVTTITATYQGKVGTVPFVVPSVEAEPNDILTPTPPATTLPAGTFWYSNANWFLTPATPAVIGQMSNVLDSDVFGVNATGTGPISFNFTASDPTATTVGWAVSVYDTAGNMMYGLVCTPTTAFPTCNIPITTGVLAAGKYFIDVEINKNSCAGQTGTAWSTCVGKLSASGAYYTVTASGSIQ